MDKIKVLIADDHAIVRMGLSALLETKPDIEVVGEAANGDLAVKKALKLKPDIVIMDLLMPGLDGIAATKALHEQVPDIKVLVLTTSTVSDDLSRALQNGASGIVIKSSSNGTLVQAIRDIAAGKRYLPKEVSNLISQDPPVGHDLTDRQTQILQLVAQGQSTYSIAQDLNLSEIMVKKHLSAVFRKLGAANRTEAVAIALRKQLVKM